MRRTIPSLSILMTTAVLLAVSCAGTGNSTPEAGTSPAPATVTDIWPDAFVTARDMGIGINIGNTLENTTLWETGWGQPPITRGLIHRIAELGFGVVRLPVAWDTWAVDGVIQEDKFARVEEVVDWILAEGMYCVVNIHWDGGWIDSSWEEKFPDTLHTFSDDAARKFPSYWHQIATRLGNKGPRLVFEGLNEETNFENEGDSEDAYATLTRVNQLFVDTVRATGGNNAQRVLIVTGYSTDIMKTTSYWYRLPEDPAENRLMLSVHYYTPWQFCGMSEDASWGKMQATWGGKSDMDQLDRLWDTMEKWSKENDVPVFVGEFGVVAQKAPEYRSLFMSSVARTCRERGMIPVLWDTGSDMGRADPWPVTPELTDMVQAFKDTPAPEQTR